MFNELFIFDLYTRNWSLIDPKNQNPGRVFGHTAWLHNQNLYILGGLGEIKKMSEEKNILEDYGIGSSPLLQKRRQRNGFWRFDFSKMEWSEVWTNNGEIIIDNNQKDLQS